MLTLNQMLDTFDIPLMRRDISDKDNVRWLIRNLPINNRNNPNLSRVILLLSNRS